MASGADFGGHWQGVYYSERWGYQIATVDVSQNGVSLSGTYSTSTGVDGTISGTANGTAATLTITQNPSCVGLFNGTATLRGDVLTVEMTGYDCSDSGTGYGVLSRNMLDYYPWASIAKVKYVNGYIEGDFWTSLNAPAPLTVQSATVITPNFDEYQLERDENDGNWESTVMNFPASELSSRFPDGIYYYNVRFTNDTTGTAFAILAGEYPNAFPELLNPLEGDNVDPANPLTVSWSPTDASVTAVYIDVGNYPGQMLPAAAVQFTVPENTLEMEKQDVWLSFVRNSGYNSSKNLVSVNYFFPGSRLIESMVGLFRVKAPTGETGMAFFSELNSSVVSSATVTTPDSEVLPYAYDALQRDWSVTVGGHEADIAARFQDGTYRINATFVDGSSETRDIILAGDFPAAFPAISQPVHGCRIDTTASQLQINWEAWQSETGITLAEIKQVQSIPAAWNAYPTYVRNIWDDDFAPSVSQAAVSTASLPDHGVFELGVMYFNLNGEGAVKGTRSSVYFSTPRVAGSTSFLPALRLLLLAD